MFSYEGRADEAAFLFAQLSKLPLFPAQEVVHQSRAVHQRQQPGAGSCQADAHKPQAPHGQPGGNAAAHQLADAADDGVNAVAHALQGVAHDHQAAVQAEQQAHNAQILHADLPRQARVSPQHQPGKGSLPQEDHHPGGGAVAQLDLQPVPDAAADAVIPPGSGILAGIGGHAHAHGFHRQSEHLTDLLTGGLPRHHSGAQGVDGPLHHHSAQGRHGVLKAHGKRDAAQVPGVPGGKPPQAPAALQQVGAQRQPGQVQQAAERLAQHRCQSRAPHPQGDRHDERIVQHNIQPAAQQQKQGGPFGIPGGAQRAGAEIIQHRAGDPQKDDAGIPGRIVENIRRRPQQPQKPVRQGGAAARQYHRQGQAQPYPVPEVALEAGPISGPHRLGQGDAEAHAAALHKAQDQKAQGVGGAHRRQGLRADEPAHHHRIHKGIQLLEQGACHQGQGKQQYLL